MTQIIDAQALVARDELVALNAEIARVGTELEAVRTDIAALQAQASDRRAIRDRLTRDAFRLAAASSTPSLAALSGAQIEAYRELLTIDTSLRDAQTRLSDRAAQLAGAQDAVAAKQGQFARLRDRARTIAAAAANGEGDQRAAEVAVLEALARDAAAAQTSLAQLVATAMAGDGTAPSTWSLPVRGAITQPFGPTTFPLEPARNYNGAYYAHFHDGIDLAAPLAQPVVAAAEGRVTFVGHLSDGAMVVIIAHAGGGDRLRRTHRHHDRPASALRYLACRSADRSAVATRFALAARGRSDVVVQVEHVLRVVAVLQRRETKELLLAVSTLDAN